METCWSEEAGRSALPELLCLGAPAQVVPPNCRLVQVLLGHPGGWYRFLIRLSRSSGGARACGYRAGEGFCGPKQSISARVSSALVGKRKL